METTHIAVDRAEAEQLYRKYKEHQNCSTPIDWEVQRTYQLLAKARRSLRHWRASVQAGVDEKGLPKLALAGATAKACYLERLGTRRTCVMRSTDNWRSSRTGFIFCRPDLHLSAR